MQGCGDVLLCGVGSFGGGIALDEPAQEGAGERAASAVGGAGFDKDAGEPDIFAGWGQEEVVGWVEMASGGEDAEAGSLFFRDLGLESVAGAGQIVALGDGKAGEDGELGQVWRDPVDEREQPVAEERNSFRIEQFPAG